MIIYLTVGMILALLVCYMYDIDIAKSKNIYLLFIAILMLFLYKEQCNADNMENFGNVSKEAIQNIASVYNTKNMTVDNLTVTGNTTLAGKTTLKDVDMKGNLNVDATGQIKLAMGAATININPMTGITLKDPQFRPSPAVGMSNSVVLPQSKMAVFRAGEIKMNDFATNKEARMSTDVVYSEEIGAQRATIATNINVPSINSKIPIFSGDKVRAGAGIYALNGTIIKA